MIELRKISANSWDYVLYQSTDGIFVLKVMFNEGEYKVDIGRYFEVDLPGAESVTVDVLHGLAKDIRSNYPNISYPEVEKFKIKITL